MIDLMGFFKKRKEGKLQKAEKEIEAVRLAFTQRYLNFKSLLSTNDKVLEIINELEQAPPGAPRIRHVLCPGAIAPPFRSTFIRSFRT